MKLFYMTIGYPGSGKSFYAEKMYNNFESTKLIIVHDQEVINFKKLYGQNKARKMAHEYLTKRITELTEDLVIYDSINMNSEGRKYFLDLVPKDYTIVLLYFKRSNMIPEKVEEYVDKLYSIRDKHICFPSNRERGIETIINIYNNFHEITEEEKNKYDIITKESYIDSIS